MSLGEPGEQTIQIKDEQRGVDGHVEDRGHQREPGFLKSPEVAIYPTLFVLYLNRLFPWFAQGHRGLMVGVAVVAVCALLNIAGVRVVSTTSLWLFFALSAPFALMVFLSPFKFGALAHAVTKPT